MSISLRRLALVSLALCAGASSALARPVADEQMNGQILERQDLPYRFEQHKLDSADGQRHYRLWIGVPRRAAPAGGYAVAYLLDGNAAIGVLDASLLSELDAGKPPLLVAIGTDTPLRIDRTARTHDYTPKRDVPAQLDPLTQLPSGGADAFLDLLERQVKPLIARHYPVNAQEQTLWGHSYGGLLVMHALLTRPGDFRTYAAASPSFWWGDGAIRNDLPGFAGRLKHPPVQLLLLRGDQEAVGKQGPMSGPAGQEAAKAVLETLQGNGGLKVENQWFPGLTHGPMLPESLRYTLRWLAR